MGILSGITRTCRFVIDIIIALILPPLAVFFERGCGDSLLINILLTILGYLPGSIHAIYVVFFTGHGGHQRLD